MSRVDLTALRLAVYELKFDPDVPVGVAINEAVELAKRFGGETSGSFRKRHPGQGCFRGSMRDIESFRETASLPREGMLKDRVYSVGQVNRYVKNMFAQDFFSAGNSL